MTIFRSKEFILIQIWSYKLFKAEQVKNYFINFFILARSRKNYMSFAEACLTSKV